MNHYHILTWKWFHNKSKKWPRKALKLLGENKIVWDHNFSLTFSSGVAAKQGGWLYNTQVLNKYRHFCHHHQWNLLRLSRWALSLPSTYTLCFHTLNSLSQIHFEATWSWSGVSVYALNLFLTMRQPSHTCDHVHATTDEVVKSQTQCKGKVK